MNADGVVPTTFDRSCAHQHDLSFVAHGLRHSAHMSQLSGGAAAVPDAVPSAGTLYDKLGQPLLDVKAASQPAAVPSTTAASAGAAVVPTSVPGPPGSGGLVPGSLTAAQRSELAMAKRRADKAAAGKRTRVLSTLIDGPDGDQADEDIDIQKHSDEIEAKIAAMEDEKEAKRLKRLLRNRISAQQARERKKTYVQSLEQRAKEHEDRAQQLDERVRQLECENKVLRTVIKNMSNNDSQQSLLLQQD